MQLLIASTKEGAAALNEKALLWLQDNVAGANMGQWSPLYTDGSKWGISWEDRLVPAFTADELASGTVMDESGNEVVVHAAVIESDEKWAVWVEPAPPAQELS